MLLAAYPCLPLCWCSCTKNSPDISGRCSGSEGFRRERLHNVTPWMCTNYYAGKSPRRLPTEGMKSNMYHHLWIHPFCCFPAPHSAPYLLVLPLSYPLPFPLVSLIQQVASSSLMYPGRVLPSCFCSGSLLLLCTLL